MRSNLSVKKPADLCSLLEAIDDGRSADGCMGAEEEADDAAAVAKRNIRACMDRVSRR